VPNGETLATWEIDSAHLTSPGSTLGTVAYMSPEQVRAKELDSRSDLFSFGVILYEMATGQLPFRGESTGVIYTSILERAPVPAARLNPDLPARLDEIIGKALEKDRNLRYQHASEMCADLRRLKRDVDSGRSASHESAGASVPVEASFSSAQRSSAAVAAASAASLVPIVTASRRKLWIAVAVGTVLIAAAATALLRLRPTSTASASAEVQSLAVLPFTTNSTEATGEYLTDGITEGVINDLSQLPGLRVMARSTVFRFKGKDNDPQQVGAALKVDSVVTGHVARLGDNFTVQAELVKVTDGTQLWGQRFTRKVQDVSLLQGDIAHGLASRLGSRLSGEEQNHISTAGTRNAEAYDAFVKGRFNLALRNRQSIRSAIENFKRAVAVDPTYADAYASLAIAYDVAPGYLEKEELKGLSSGRAEAEQALALDPKSSNAHMALATVDEGEFKWAEAEREFRLAFESDPNNAAAHYFYAHSLLIPQKRYDEALAEYQKALSVDPLSGIVNANYGFALSIARRFEEARSQFHKTLQIDPSFEVALRRDADLEAYLGNYETARQLYLRTSLPALKRLNSATPKEAYYRARIEAARTEWGVEAARSYAMLGETDKAFQGLEQMLKDDSVDLVTWIRAPEFDSIRADPRYCALMRRMNLPQ
jgi:eukaryotic-like serine/threonine-protein kinase